MSATDELRRMLDERGVVWADCSDVNRSHTVWNGFECWFIEYGDGWTVWGMSKKGTPEQAVEATLGRGTCYNTDPVPLCWSLTCSECGVHSITEGRRFNYCPNCGAKVVE